MRYIYVIIILLLANQSSNAQMTTRVVRDSLFIPWELVWGPDNHIWFTQKNGFVCRMNPTNGYIDTLYNETNSTIQAEGGMLGLALHPNFTATPYVYSAYNYTQNGYRERIVRYTYNSLSKTLSNPTILLDNIPSANYHNGCRLIIINNQLYITTGDATNTSTSQNVGDINGKTLRINLDGSIPNDNPISGSPVWSWGHRNAQGLVYANNRIYSSEHGPNNDDELNILLKGRNYGWPDVEGFCNTAAEQAYCIDSNIVEPLYAWTPTVAVSGIDYYNHPMFPQLKNSILMATLKDKKLHQLQLNPTTDAITSTSIINQVNFDRLRDLCIAPSGNIFISTSNSRASGTGTFVDKIIELYDPSFMSVNNINTQQYSVSLHPNPTRNKVKIESSTPTLHFNIYNLLGQVVLTGQIDKSVVVIDISMFSNGTYFMEFTNTAGLNKKLRFIKL